MKMKYLMSLVIFCGLYGALNAQENQEEEQPLLGAKIFFAESAHNFGDINQGDRVEHVFELENIGNEPLIVSDVRTTCGCTAPEWPREPVPPGAKSSLKVVFNSTGKVGMQNKVITVMSNAVNSPARVKIVTNVMPKDSGR